MTTDQRRRLTQMLHEREQLGSHLRDHFGPDLRRIAWYGPGRSKYDRMLSQMAAAMVVSEHEIARMQEAEVERPGQD
jgi:hypothetical protein